MLVPTLEGYFSMHWIESGTDANLIPLRRDFGPLESRTSAAKIGGQANSTLFELPCVLVRFDHIARFIVNANQSIM